MQPRIGPTIREKIPPMVRTTKKDRPPPLIRGVLASNLKSLRDVRYHDLGSDTAKNSQLAKDGGTTLSQIQRILAQSVGPSIDQLEGLSRALKCSPADLLTPYFKAASAGGGASSKSAGRAACG